MRGARTGFSGVRSACAAIALLLLAWHASPALCAAAQSASLRSLDLTSSGEAAALTIDLDRATSYRLFTLSRPARVVLDLSESRRPMGVHLPRARGIVRSVRAGRRPGGALRLVVELDAQAAPDGHLRLPVHARWIRRRGHGASRLIVTIGAPDASGVAVARDGAVARDVAVARDIAVARDPPAAPRAVRAAHAPVLSDRDVVIAVDAGHGGKDPGAIGPDGIEEKNVTLAIARALAARIDAAPGMRAVLTRDSDVFLPLRERIRLARAARADLFVSVHADSVRDRAVSGASVYILSEHGATDEAARWLAERENAADRIGGISLADKNRTLASVLLDLTQSASISESMTAAREVLTALDRVGEVRKNAVQQAGFVVLKSPDIPSMLIETAYISNPADERRLRTASEQRKLASAIFSGLLDYFEQHPPAGTRFARLRGHGEPVLAAGAGGEPPTASATP